jgi:hypothetical protein
MTVQLNAHCACGTRLVICPGCKGERCMSCDPMGPDDDCYDGHQGGWRPGTGEEATFAARCEAIRQLEGWPRLVESHELAKRINRGDFDGAR